MRNDVIKDANIFFGSWNYMALLDVIAVYHYMQNQQNLMKQSQENGRKPLFWRQLAEYFGDTFFFKNRASSLFQTRQRLAWCKKSKESNGGKYENFCHGQTDGRSWFHRTRRSEGRVQKTNQRKLTDKNMQITLTAISKRLSL